MTSVSEHIPCFRAFFDERLRPSGETGPFPREPLRRAESLRAWLVVAASLWVRGGGCGGRAVCRAPASRLSRTIVAGGRRVPGKRAGVGDRPPVAVGSRAGVRVPR